MTPFFLNPRRGPQQKPKKNRAHQMIVQLRKQNYSVYDISQALKDIHLALSPTTVREVLKEEGFAPLPRRLDEERHTVEPVADVRRFALHPRTFTTRCGGLFLFVADLARLDLDRVARTTRLPSSRMIPNTHALRACLALKRWSIERKSHIMALVSDEGLALFSGLNCIVKKSYLSEYSSRVDHRMTLDILARWHQQLNSQSPSDPQSFNLDFHSVPYHGSHPVVERHYVSGRSRRQPSILVFLAPNADERTFCYSNADLRKGEEAEQTVTLAGCPLRQIYALDLGHEEPSVLLTNDRHRAVQHVITRYAQRMLVDNAISDAVRFFHMDALSFSVLPGPSPGTLPSSHDVRVI